MRKLTITFKGKGRFVLASHGTLIGDVLWIITIAFVFAIITGIVG
jgi:hypothetical protein